MITLLFLGIGSTFFLKREIFPKFEGDQVMITVPMGNPSTAEQIDRNVVQLIQPRIQRVSGVKEVRSSATDSMALLEVDLSSSFNSTDVKERIASEIKAIDAMPGDVIGPFVVLREHFKRAFQISIWGDHAGEKELREVAEWVVQDIRTRGLATLVSIRSPRNLEFAIHIPQRILEAKSLSLHSLAKQIKSFNIELTAGSIHSSSQTVTIKGSGRRLSVEEIGEIPIRFPNGEFQLLRDLVGNENIVDGFAEKQILTETNGHRAIFLEFEKSENEDLLVLADGLRDYAKSTILPNGMQMGVGLDSSLFVRDRLELILKNGFTGLALVILVLSLFLDWQIAFWASTGIALSLVGSLFLLLQTGGSINMLTLFGFLIAIGIVVDDAIVVGDAFFEKRRIGKTPKEAAIEALAEVRMPVVAMMGTTIIAFIPLLLVEGRFGGFMKAIPVVVISALCISLLESMLILPVHLAHHAGDRRTPLTRCVQVLLWPLIRVTETIQPVVTRALARLINRVIVPMVRWAVFHRYAVVVAFVGATIGTAGLIPAGIVKTSLFPKPDADLHVAKVDFDHGTPIQRTEMAMRTIVEGLTATATHYALRDGINPVANYYLVVGDPGPHHAEIIVELTPTDEGRSVSGQEFLDAWRSRIPNIPNLSQLTFIAAGAGPPVKAIEVWLSSRNKEQLEEAEEALHSYLAQVDGVVDYFSSNQLGAPSISVRMREEFSNLPTSDKELITTLCESYQGTSIDTFNRGEHEVKMMLRNDLSDRRSLTNLRNILLPSGLRVGQVAELTASRRAAEVIRVNGARTIQVGAEADLTSGANAADIRRKLELEFLNHLDQKFPDVRWVYSGESKEGNEAISDMIRGYLPALLGIYCMIATLFRSYTQPVIIMLAIPFSFVGAIIGHLVMSLPINLMSGFGIISLTGIAVNDSLVLIDCINSNILEGKRVMDALLLAVRRRTRPILLTSLTTIAGLCPILFESSFQAQFLIPMVTSIVFGLLFATLLILILIPVGYQILCDLGLGITVPQTKPRLRAPRKRASRVLTETRI